MKSESLAECCAALLLLERNQHISNSLSIKVNLSSVGQRMQWARVRLCCCHSGRCRCAYSLLFLRFCFVLTMFSGHGWPTSSYTDHWQWTCTDCVAAACADCEFVVFLSITEKKQCNLRKTVAQLHRQNIVVRKMVGKCNRMKIACALENRYNCHSAKWCAPIVHAAMHSTQFKRKK